MKSPGLSAKRKTRRFYPVLQRGALYFIGSSPHTNACKNLREASISACDVLCTVEAEQTYGMCKRCAIRLMRCTC
jgi:hypothetical protein